LLEPDGDVWPRGMTVASQDVQNPAYRPTPPLFVLSIPGAAIVAPGMAHTSAGDERRFIAKAPTTLDLPLSDAFGAWIRNEKIPCFQPPCGGS
jgi:hypothetical protein